MEYLKRLESKWGKFEKSEFYYTSCLLNECPNYLHVIYYPVHDYEQKIAKDEELLNATLSPELKEIYKVCNGFMAFNESLFIYGLDGEYQGKYKPSLIFRNNMIFKLSYLPKDCKEYILFGEYSQWLFCYEKDDFSKVYSVDKYTGNILHIFNTIKDLINYYFDYLIDEYDINGKKIHKFDLTKGTFMEEISLEEI